MPSAEHDPRNSAVNLRPITLEDMDFLRKLYATNRYDIDRLQLPQAQKEQFLSMQFEAQHDHYQRYFTNATFDLIRLGNEPIGRIYVAVNDDEIRLIDIALLPEYRGQGIGANLIDQLLQKSREISLPIRLRVEPDNPALRLYQRLGFQTIAAEQTNLQMEWNPASDGDEPSIRPSETE